MDGCPNTTKQSFVLKALYSYQEHNLSHYGLKLIEFQSFLNSKFKIYFYFYFCCVVLQVVIAPFEVIVQNYVQTQYKGSHGGILYTWHVATGQKSFPTPYVETLNLQTYFPPFQILSLPNKP